GFCGPRRGWECTVPKLEQIARSCRPLLLAGVAALALSACASNRGQMGAADYSGITAAQSQASLGELTARYRANPGDRNVAIHYAAALRAAGQPQQAAAALEQALARYPNDVALSIAYRSEEHTSELQSRENLVCRLLLEKKNNKHKT